MVRTRRATIGALAALLPLAGCLNEGESSETALAAELGERGETSDGSLWVALTVENAASGPAAGTCYVRAAAPGRTHTEARYYELDAGERVTERVVFPDVDAAAFEEAGGFLRVSVA
jgi:hypothetical protein